ncbi:MAG: uncharacterized protein JWN70_656 [Planctomycetaceae bacterium]|nr:uncharacterized protein [Planctomycetaceae bacterium]
MGNKFGGLILCCMVFAGCAEAAKHAPAPATAFHVQAMPAAEAKSAVEAAPEFNTESYAHITDNRFLSVAQNPLSTFSIDVDTASYSNVRRFLNEGQLPPPGAVRIEEMLNYFTYDYPQPADGVPFSVNVEIAACPWKAEHRLVRIGLKGKQIAAEKRPVSNLVFLLDVSGSMQDPSKLPLLKQGMKLLVDQLTENDRVAIVVYAGASGTVLNSTTADHKPAILSAIENLQAGGSTNGAAGIEEAYRIASQHFIKQGTNRVILCTDGDFNVGQTSEDALTRLIEDKAKSGVFLSVLGFGTGNLKDSTMELLADKGNGNYAYIDSLNEARKVLVDQMQGTLITIAKDVKIQVEFNPARAAAYRLIGYENRLLAKEDFNDDKKDAGEIGAGHTVTALYEVDPVGASLTTASVDPLKYQPNATPTETKVTDTKFSDELLTLKLRYKQPAGDESQLSEFPIADQDRPLAQASPDFAWAAAVAAFGMILRDSEFKGTATLPAVLEIAESSKGKDLSEYRAEFIRLVKLAIPLKQLNPAITKAQ